MYGIGGMMKDSDELQVSESAKHSRVGKGMES